RRTREGSWVMYVRRSDSQSRRSVVRLSRVHNIFRLEQVEQMTLGRKDIPITRTDSGANVFGLAEFLRDDDLVGHDGLVWKNRFESATVRTAQCGFWWLRAKGQPVPNGVWTLSAVSGKNAR